MAIYPLRFNYHGSEIIKVVFDIANNRITKSNATSPPPCPAS